MGKVDNWILVTGAPRSGTTFVGDILACPLSVDYFHEPFNPECGIREVKSRYVYMKKDNIDLELDAGIKRIFDYTLKLRTAYYRNDSNLRKLVKTITGSRGPVFLRLAKANVLRSACVIKDPIACLMTEYLNTSYGVRPLVILRHPVGFVASVLRLGWDTELDLRHLSNQKDLVDEYFQGDEAFLDRKYETRLEQAAAMWRALNKVLQMQISRHSEWMIVRHEDLSSNPIDRFKTIFHHFDLPFTQRVQSKILRHTSSTNGVESKKSNVQTLARNSASIFEFRKAMLTASERRIVFSITQDVALNYYDEASFDLE